MELIDILRQACRRALENGLHIRSSDYGVYLDRGFWTVVDNCVCPTGAVLLGRAGHKDAVFAAATLLGVSPSYIIEFTRGFDGYAGPIVRATEEQKAGYLAGQQLRKEFIEHEAALDHQN